MDAVTAWADAALTLPPAVLAAARSRVSTHFRRLETRYGVKGARRVLAAGLRSLSPPSGADDLAAVAPLAVAALILKEPCKPGERADLTGCTPAEDDGGNKPAAGPKPGKKPAGKPNNNGGESTPPGGDDPAANRPTKPSERRAGVKPPAREFVAPPPPKGEKGKGKAGGFTAVGKTNTAVGDEIEDLLTTLGFRSITPVGKNGKRVRQNPLDVEMDHSGYAFEMKACTTAAQEYKAKPKAREAAEKVAYAKKHKLKAGIIIAVADYDRGEAHFYWRLGIGAFALNPKDGGKLWNYAGSAKMKG